MKKPNLNEEKCWNCIYAEVIVILTNKKENKLYTSKDKIFCEYHNIEFSKNNQCLNFTKEGDF